MLDQLDMFAAPEPPAPAPATHVDGDVEYTVLPRGNRFVINWICGERTGVIGGIYPDQAEALRCIEFRKELRAAGIVDPRPWMRTPPEGECP